MLALAPTSVVIQAFEGRFTRFGEQDFLISNDGTEAYPIRPEERDGFVRRYRRAMRIARALRWLGTLSFLPMLILTSKLGDLQFSDRTHVEDLPGWDEFSFAILFLLPAAGIFQHMITSDVVIARIMRRVENRFPTRLSAVVKPRLNKSAKIGFMLLFIGSAIDLGFRLYFGFAPDSGFEDAHMRALYGFTGSNDPWYAQVTAGLLKLAHLAFLVGVALLWASRNGAKPPIPDPKNDKPEEPGAVRQRT